MLWEVASACSTISAVASGDAEEVTVDGCSSVPDTAVAVEPDVVGSGTTIAVELDVVGSGTAVAVDPSATGASVLSDVATADALSAAAFDGGTVVSVSASSPHPYCSHTASAGALIICATTLPSSIKAMPITAASVSTAIVALFIRYPF